MGRAGFRRGKRFWLAEPWHPPRHSRRGTWRGGGSHVAKLRPGNLLHALRTCRVVLRRLVDQSVADDKRHGGFLRSQLHIGLCLSEWFRHDQPDHCVCISINHFQIYTVFF